MKPEKEIEAVARKVRMEIVHKMLSGSIEVPELMEFLEKHPQFIARSFAAYVNKILVDFKVEFSGKDLSEVPGFVINLFDSHCHTARGLRMLMRGGWKMRTK